MNASTQQADTATSTKAPPVPNAAQPYTKILEERMPLAEFTRQVHRLSVPPDIAYEELLANPEKYLEHVAWRLGPGDLIEVIDDANSYFAQWYVRMVIATRQIGVKHVDLVEVFKVKTGDASETPPATGDWCVMHRGPHDRWCVISPKGVVKFRQINTKPEADSICAREKINQIPLR